MYDLEWQYSRRPIWSNHQIKPWNSAPYHARLSYSSRMFVWVHLWPNSEPAPAKMALIQANFAQLLGLAVLIFLVFMLAYLFCWSCLSSGILVNLQFTFYQPLIVCFPFCLKYLTFHFIYAFLNASFKNVIRQALFIAKMIWARCMAFSF